MIRRSSAPFEQLQPSASTACRIIDDVAENLRQYVMVIAIGTVALFLLASFYWNWNTEGM